MKPTFRLALGVLLALLSHALQAAECDNPKRLRLAVIPMKNADKQLAEYQPLVQLLEKATQRRVEIVPATSYGSVIEGLLAGSIDVAELGPASYAQAKNQDASITAFASPTQPLGPHTDSGSHYRSLLIVRRNTGLDSLASLRTKNVSLIDPASTSGALIPRHSFPQAVGMPLESYFRRITFAGSHDRAIQAVQKGWVDAAFVSSGRLDDELRHGSLRPQELRVLWQSAPIPYDPFVYRGRLCQPLVAHIQQAFFVCQAVPPDLRRTPYKAGFTRVHDDDYREIREIYAAQP